jgi:hypothetical protein
VAKKLKLTTGSSYDFTTIGIACQMKDYRFVFFLNDQLGFQLRRTEDLHFGEGKDSRGFSFFIYYNPEERRQYYLLSNYHEEGRLIPAERGADFILIINNLERRTRQPDTENPAIYSYLITKGKANNLEWIFEEIELNLI